MPIFMSCKAASIFDGKYAVQTESYGPEARGSRAKSDVIISTEEIDYPYASELDVLIALSGATTGKIAIVKGIRQALLNQRVGKFCILNKDKLNHFQPIPFFFF